MAANVALAEAVQNPADEAVQNDIVYGIPVDDVKVVTAIRRVVLLAALGATYCMCVFIWKLMTGTYNPRGKNNENASLLSGMSQLVIELSIPACGYYGALYTHRTLVFFFCGANLIFVVASIVRLFRFVVRVSGPVVRCEEEEYVSARDVCEVWIENRAKRFFLLSSMLVLLCFGCLSVWFGKNLYQGLGPSAPAISSPIPIPLVGEVVDSPITARTERGIAPSSAGQIAMTDSHAGHRGGSLTV